MLAGVPATDWAAQGPNRDKFPEAVLAQVRLPCWDSEAPGGGQHAAAQAAGGWEIHPGEQRTEAQRVLLHKRTPEHLILSLPSISVFHLLSLSLRHQAREDILAQDLAEAVDGRTELVEQLRVYREENERLLGEKEEVCVDETHATPTFSQVQHWETMSLLTTRFVSQQ